MKEETLCRKVVVRSGVKRSLSSPDVTFADGAKVVAQDSGGLLSLGQGSSLSVCKCQGSPMAAPLDSEDDVSSNISSC